MLPPPPRSGERSRLSGLIELPLHEFLDSEEDTCSTRRLVPPPRPVSWLHPAWASYARTGWEKAPVGL